MTFDSAAWAIDGAQLTSSLARRAEFAATGGAQGIVQSGDLKVTQLGTPGVGVLVAGGVGLVRNGYQTAPNETYVVSNPTSYTIPSGDMPASNPSARSYIVAVVVGDPDFSQAGHPWMLATDPPAGTETTFQYVRPTLIQVADNTVKTLTGQYPALVLARIDIPANTTTITDAMITDLRALARPRQEQQMFVSANGTWTDAAPVYIPSAAAFGDWGAGQFHPSVDVPSWAKRAIVSARVNGAYITDTSVNISGYIRAQLGTVTGPSIAFDIQAGGGAMRLNLEAAGTYDVSGIAGTNVQLRVEGYENVPGSPTNNQKMKLRAGSQQIFDVRFFEQ